MAISPRSCEAETLWLLLGGIEVGYMGVDASGMVVNFSAGGEGSSMCWREEV
jgi:hypothetical protein